MRETGAQRLDSAGVLAVFRGKCDAAGHEDRGQIAQSGEGHHHRGKSLVAGGDAEHAAAGGQRPGEPAKEGGGVVAVGQGIEHSGGALRTAVAGVGAIGGERNGAAGADFLCGGADQFADFPVSRVIAEGDRGAIRRTETTLGGEYEELLAPEFLRLPAHAGVLRQAEEIAAGLVE